MTGVSLSERKSNECVRSMLAIDDIAEKFMSCDKTG